MFSGSCDPFHFHKVTDNTCILKIVQDMTRLQWTYNRISNVTPTE